MASSVPRDVMVVGRELAIVWEDGREDYIPLEKLRRACPCAMCKGEKDIFGNVYKGKERPYTPASFQAVAHRRGINVPRPNWRQHAHRPGAAP